MKYLSPFGVLTIFFLIAGVAVPQAHSSSLIASVACSNFGDVAVICDAQPFDFSEPDRFSYFWRSTAPQSTPNSPCNAGPNGQFICAEECFGGQFDGFVTIDVTVTDNLTGATDIASNSFSCDLGGGGFGF